ncbi:MAG: hypothetical protein IJR61_07240 [Clostridia bacterium]|nr:hypothetical protein [Clostridia bacterium]
MSTIEIIFFVLVGLIPIALDVICQWSFYPFNDIILCGAPDVSKVRKTITFAVTVLYIPLLIVLFKGALPITGMLVKLSESAPAEKNLFIWIMKIRLKTDGFYNGVPLFGRWWIDFSIAVIAVIAYYYFYVFINKALKNIVSADIAAYEAAEKRNSSMPKEYEYETTTYYDGFSDSVKSSTKRRDVTKYEVPVSTFGLTTAALIVGCIFFPLTTYAVRVIVAFIALVKNKK